MASDYFYRSVVFVGDGNDEKKKGKIIHCRVKNKTHCLFFFFVWCFFF